MKMRVGIITNGTLITKEVAKTLKKIGIDWVAISIDSHNKEIHNFIRGDKNAFNRTIQGLKNLKDNDIPLRINITLTSLNIKDLAYTLLYFGSNYKIFNFALGPVINRGKGKEFKYTISPKEYKEAVYKYNELYPRNNQFKKDNLCSECGVGSHLLFVCSNGDSALCPTLTKFDNKDFYFGNIYNMSLSKIWQNLILKFGFLNCSKTKNCKLSNKCNGGCRSNAFELTGDIYGCDIYQKELLK